MVLIQIIRLIKNTYATFFFHAQNKSGVEGLMEQKNDSKILLDQFKLTFNSSHTTADYMFFFSM